ncbi:lanthionine biosynthesis protein [Lysinibacillus irui]|uniref:lanthionine biosynthesis protein n=1 Tax=Lysinibacillus irui TaxID=2998077 RepID=UPI004044C196
MTITVTQNPFSVYRGTNTSDQWYFEMRDKAKEIHTFIDEINKIYEKIEREKENVVSQIEEEFSLQKDPKLLNLKRDVHNLRSVRLKKYEGPILLSRLVELLNQLDLYQEMLQQSYEEAVVKSREILQREIANDQLQKTVLFFNQTIYKNIEKYLSKPVQTHNKKEKKLDNFIINLLMRSSMKTSPFSYLTQTGSSGNRFLIKKKANIELNHALLFRIFLEIIRSDKEALEKIPVHVSKFGQRDSKIFYVTQENVPQSKKIYETRDKLVEMGIAEEVIQFLKKNQGQTIFYKDFAKFLRENELYSEHELDVFKRLVSTKILVQKITVNAKRNLVEEMIAYLKEQDICEDLSLQLQFMNELKKKFEEAGTNERLVLWKKIEDVIKNLSENIPNFGTEILYEDILFDSQNNKSSLKDIENKFSNHFFEEITAFLLLFDVNIRVQYEVAALYKKLYGDSETSLSDSNLLNNVFFEKLRYFFPYFQDMDYRYGEAIAPEIKILDDLRDEFKAFFSQYLDENNSKEIDFQELIKPFSKKIPEYIKYGNEFSMTFFYQLFQDKVILNDIYDGQEKFLSRFKDFFENLNDDLQYQEYVQKNYYDKNYYEVTELFGFNGGIHDRYYDQKLNLEFGNQRFHDVGHPNISEFSVKYDEQSKKLKVLDHQKKEAKVAYKSSLVPVFLPGVLSVLLLLFQSGRINFDINYFLKKRSDMPRIIFENIVMYRKKWNLKLEDFANINKEASNELELYLLINDYFLDKHLPKTFFLKKYRMGEEISAMKPLFIDITVPILFKHFINEIIYEENQDPMFYIEEVLPEFENELKEYVVEYTIDN